MSTLYYIIYNKYKKMPKEAKASLWFVFCILFQRGFQFISMPIYTRIMSVDDFGLYSTFFSWINIACVFTSLNIYCGTFNKAMIRYQDNQDTYISSVQSLTLVTSIFFVILVLIFHSYITILTGYSLKFQLLMAVYLILFPSFQYWAQKQRFMYEYYSMVVITIVSTLGTLFLGVLFVYLSDEKSFALVAVTVIIQVCFNIFFFFKNIKSTLFCKNIWKWTLVVSIPLVPHYLSEILLGHSDRIMINLMCGPAKAGIYNLIYQISMVMAILRTGINGAFAPWLYYSLKNNDYNEVKRISTLLTFFMFVLTCFIMLIAPEILKIAAPASYFVGIIGVPAIMTGSFFVYVYVLFMYVEVYYEKTIYVAIASVVATIFNIVLNYICIPKWGYISAAYTTMFSYIIMALVHYVFLNKIVKDHKRVSDIFNIKYITIFSVSIIVLSQIMIFLYKYDVLRIVIVLLIMVFVILRWNYFYSFYQIIRNKNN